MFNTKKIKELESEIFFLKSNFKNQEVDFKFQLNVLKNQLALVSEGKKVNKKSIIDGLPFDEITSQELLHKMTSNPNIKILDVRSKQEWSGGHIKGAMHIPVDQIGNQIPQVSKENELYVICASGMRSAYASEFLFQKGFTQVYNVTDGMHGYRGEVSQD